MNAARPMARAPYSTGRRRRSVMRKVDPFFASVDDIGASSSRISNPCSLTTLLVIVLYFRIELLQRELLETLDRSEGSASMPIASQASRTWALSCSGLPVWDPSLNGAPRVRSAFTHGVDVFIRRLLVATASGTGASVAKKRAIC